MKTEDLTRFGIDLTTDSCQHPMAFAEEMLQRVSRTFALNIRVLPQTRLRIPVLLAYLYCRMADTIEDCHSLSTERKVELLSLFQDIFFGSPDHWERWSQTFRQALPATWSTSENDEEFLCAHCHWTVPLFFSLPSRLQPPIAQCIHEMCDGMASFALRQEQSRGQWLAIRNEKDFDLYCYFVAGVVGNMLCDLYALQSPWINAARHGQMRKLAVSFGLALQTINIIKDVREDSLREVCFWPQEWLSEAGFSHPSLFFSQTAGAEARRQVVARMTEKAWRHLQDAMDYTLLIPSIEPRLRLFCLWPLLMAAETLVAVGSGDSLFDPNHKVKITRKAVKKILRDSTLFCWSGLWLRLRLRRLRRIPR